MKPWRLVAPILVAGLLASEARADAIGVLIVPVVERDAALADNLTEVAMARIAETPGRTLAGTVELRRRLGVEGGRDVSACLEQPACLGRVGVSLGVTRLVTGAVRGEEGRFFLNLALTDITAVQVTARFFRQVDGPVPALVRALQEGVDELFDRRRAPGSLRVISDPEGARVTVDDVYLGTTPLVSGALVPGSHRVRVELDRRFTWKSVVQLEPSQSLELKLGSDDLPPRRTWAPYAAYGMAGGALGCVLAGGIFGSMAQMAPAGETREAAQMDHERRRTFGNVSTALFVSGAVVAVVSAAIFYRYWRDITSE